MRLLGAPGLEKPTGVYPICSVAVVAASSVLALFCFNEQLSLFQTLGLVVGLTAVVLLNR